MKISEIETKQSKDEEGFLVRFEDGEKVFVSKEELHQNIDTAIPKFKWQDLLKATKNLKSPKPLRALLFLKTEEDRLNYLNSLPKRSIESLTTAFVYMLLKGQVLEKAISLGISVPGQVASFLEEVEATVKQTGELTLNGIKTAIQSVVNTGIAIAVIMFGLFLLSNPVFWPAILPVMTVMEIAMLSQNQEKS